MTEVGRKPPLKHKREHFKYAMTKRKEQWKSINDPLEKLLMVPLEEQSSVLKDVVTQMCYNDLALMLNLPTIELIHEPSPSSVDTIIPYIPPYASSIVSEPKLSVAQQSQESYRSTLSTSSSSSSSQYDSASVSNISKITQTDVCTHGSETKISSEQFDVLSDFVEVEKTTPEDHELMVKHKAILKFLRASEAEAATWRLKEATDVSDLSKMTLAEQGDFLIHKIAVDFCDGMRQLGGEEQSFISEDILKELFEIGMDNPASRALCIEPQEKKALYYKLAAFLQVPEKSFHEILSLHLNWDSNVEKKPTKLIAFGKHLPKDLRFVTPKNKTAETWLEWNKLSADQLSFADVYSTITDLRSTKEYCKWLLKHPEHKKPQYLVDQGMFERSSSGRQKSSSSSSNRRLSQRRTTNASTINMLTIKNP